jgi:hypothetical protein
VKIYKLQYYGDISIIQHHAGSSKILEISP